MASSTTAKTSESTKAASAAATTSTTPTTTNSASAANGATNKAAPTKMSRHLPRGLKLRDGTWGWLHLAALLYCAVAAGGGMALLWRAEAAATGGGSSGTDDLFFTTTTTMTTALYVMAGTWCIFHGRVWASYLVHEAAHATLFVQPFSNRVAGVVALWCAGCPYADFDHIKVMHLSHHNDRGDTLEWDHRAFLSNHAWIKRLILAAEYVGLPGVEVLLHLRTALWPLGAPSGTVTDSRFWSAAVGTPVTVLWYAYLGAQHGTSLTGWCTVLLPYLFAQAMVLQCLAINDCFQHTYEALLVGNLRTHVFEGPPPHKTRQYEQDNTFSTLVSTQYPLLNTILALNFGYHNAHHEKAMTPWYNLPQLHDSLYGSAAVDTETNRGLLPLADLLYSWHKYRLLRVVEHDYGVVRPPGTPARAHDFFGAAGVSFLTV